MDEPRRQGHLLAIDLARQRHDDLRRLTEQSADLQDPTRIFSWEISQSYDDKGNAIIYEYAQENADNVEVWRPHEHNRSRAANRYIKRIKYGNVVSRLDDANLLDPARQWLFEVVFDYGEHSAVPPSTTVSRGNGCAARIRSRATVPASKCAATVCASAC